MKELSIAVGVLLSPFQVKVIFQKLELFDCRYILEESLATEDGRDTSMDARFH